MSSPPSVRVDDQSGAWYGLSVLLVAYTFSFVDRTILSLLVEPIKADLGISDTQISLLHGLAFAIFYTILGIPIARLADRFSRRWIITLGVLVWSAMTVLCGTARTFWTLFLARVGVGIGEAALTPAAYSMLADYFAPTRLARALGIYSAGVYVGAGLAFMIGGVAVEIVSKGPAINWPIVGQITMWQAVFFMVGMPGLIVAVLTWTMREPDRNLRKSSPPATPADQLGSVPASTLTELIRFIRTHRYSFGAHFAGYSLLSLTFNAFIAWGPTYLVRAFDMPRVDVGLSLGWLLLVFGTAGIITGGWLADTLCRRGRSDGSIITGVISAAGVAITLPLAFLGQSVNQALFWIAPFMFFSSFAYGAAAAALQQITPSRMRAQVSAIYLFVLNLIGIGFGATAVALVTDVALKDESAFGVSIAIVGTCAAILGGIVLSLGRRPFRESARAVAPPA